MIRFLPRRQEKDTDKERNQICQRSGISYSSTTLPDNPTKQLLIPTTVPINMWCCLWPDWASISLPLQPNLLSKFSEPNIFAQIEKKKKNLVSRYWKNFLAPSKNIVFLIKLKNNKKYKYQTFGKKQHFRIRACNLQLTCQIWPTDCFYNTYKLKIVFYIFK